MLNQNIAIRNNAVQKTCEERWSQTLNHMVINFPNIALFNRNIQYNRVIYKDIFVPIMMIEHTIFARSNTVLCYQNSCLLSYNIVKEGLVKILLD